ncbi:MAG TPA: DNA mismatch repair protein MutS [Spirochaetaceae bacterium]|jgi:DNA-nicking Smr family endonuclease|nr:DNA mismatch repair protein MutS [Spirochaetaceae bacterium]
MDFGDIMNDWDARKQESARKAAAMAKVPPARESPARSAQERWLELHGVSQDALRDEEGESGLYLSRRDIDAMPVDAILDLHGKTATEAESALADFFNAARARSSRKLLIIHGKGLHSEGESVLGTLVARWLERCPAAGRNGKADRTQGGSGATWVLVKGGDQRSR